MVTKYTGSLLWTAYSFAYGMRCANFAQQKILPWIFTEELLDERVDMKRHLMTG